MIGPGKLLKERTNTYGATATMGYQNIGSNMKMQSNQKRLTLQSKKQGQ